MRPITTMAALAGGPGLIDDLEVTRRPGPSTPSGG
jgi:hypothetical protein